MWKPIFSMLAPGGWRAPCLPIAIFHRVTPEADELFPGEVTAIEFDAICGWLRAWFNVLPLQQAAERLAAGTLPARPLAITFDDGYADNHDVALPILRRHGLPATFFIATGFLDGGRMWNDTVIESVRRCTHEQLDLRGTVADSLGLLGLAGVEQRRAAVGGIVGATKYLEPEVRSQWVAAVAECSGAELPTDLMMTGTQVKTLHDAGMTIGAHTVNHPILARLDRAQATREIRDGRRDLERLIGAPVRLFAYPNGRPELDYGPEAVEIVKELGFDAAVTTAWRAARRGDDIHQLPRFTPWDRSRSTFAMRMAWTMARS